MLVSFSSQPPALAALFGTGITGDDAVRTDTVRPGVVPAVHNINSVENNLKNQPIAQETRFSALQSARQQAGNASALRNTQSDTLFLTQLIAQSARFGETLRTRYEAIAAYSEIKYKPSMAGKPQQITNNTNFSEIASQASQTKTNIAMPDIPLLSSSASKNSQPAQQIQAIQRTTSREDATPATNLSSFAIEFPSAEVQTQQNAQRAETAFNQSNALDGNTHIPPTPTSFDEQIEAELLFEKPPSVEMTI